MPGARRDADGEVAEARGVMALQYLLRRHAKAREFLQREIDTPALGVRPHVTQDVGELKGLAQIHGVVARARVGVAKNLDAQQTDHGSNAIAVLLQLGVGLVALDVEVHLHAPDQIIEQLEAQPGMRADDGLQFAVHGELRRAAGAGPAQVLAPGRQLGAARFHGHGFLVGHVIHLATEGVERGHAVALGLGQQDEGEREVARALLRNVPALLHRQSVLGQLVVGARRRQAAGLLKRGIGGPVFAAPATFAAMTTAGSGSRTRRGTGFLIHLLPLSFGGGGALDQFSPLPAAVLETHVHPDEQADGDGQPNGCGQQDVASTQAVRAGGLLDAVDKGVRQK